MAAESFEKLVAWIEKSHDRYLDKFDLTNVATPVARRDNTPFPEGVYCYDSMFEAMVKNPSSADKNNSVGGETSHNWNGNAYNIDGDDMYGPKLFWQWGGQLDTNGNGFRYDISTWGQRNIPRIEIKDFNDSK